MKPELFVHRTKLPVSAEEAFQWHARPGAFERLTPPWERVEIVEQTGGIENGARTILMTRLGPIRLKWIAEHRDFVEGRQFCDVQIQGLFSRWKHTHRFEPINPQACWMEDRIEYALPMGTLGAMCGGPMVRRKLQRLFEYRHKTLRHNLETHKRYAGPPMNILVTGASGLVGSALVPFLSTGGHRIIKLGRRFSGADSSRAYWEPAQEKIDLSGLGALDAVVHLAGETVAQRWAPAAKERIRDSRVKGTRLLSEALARLPQPPRVLVCASATGYYGDRGAEMLDEQSVPGTGFLADVCREWEAAAAPALAGGIRVVHLRFGIVLTPHGGALGKMLPTFRWGVGGRLGSGRQYWSWIALEDVLGTIHHALTNEKLSGPVNAVAPHPVTNADFTQTLGSVLGRPTLFAVPAFAIGLLFGQMGEEALMSSFRVRPANLKRVGFVFRFPELEPALRYMLGE